MAKFPARVTIDLKGPAGNTMAVGARVEHAIRDQIGGSKADLFRQEFLTYIQNHNYDEVLDFCADWAEVTYFNRR